MIIRTWLFLSVLGGLVQLVLGTRCRKQWAGILVPVPFILFAVYACADLSRIGIDFPVLFCFWLSPAFQLLLFELTFWKKRSEEAKSV